MAKAETILLRWMTAVSGLQMYSDLGIEKVRCLPVGDFSLVAGHCLHVDQSYFATGQKLESYRCWVILGWFREEA